MACKVRWTDEIVRDTIDAYIGPIRFDPGSMANMDASKLRCIKSNLSN